MCTRDNLDPLPEGSWSRSRSRFILCPGNWTSQLRPGAMVGRTRNESGTILGAPGPLPLAALPTAREVYLAICFTEEEDAEQGALETVALQVEQQFNKVTPTLSLIKHKNTLLKISKLLENVKKFKRKAQTANEKKFFLLKLDKIFDIAVCQHSFERCQDTAFCNKQSCKIQDLHLNCPCNSIDKVPPEERHFMSDQRSRCKLGDKGKLAMAGVNHVQTKRDQRTVEKRTEVDEPNEKDILEEYAEDINLESDHEEDEMESVSDSSEDDYRDDAVMRHDRARKKNYIKLENTAREADRYNFSNRAVADIATAVLMDYGVIDPEDAFLAVDPKKVHRARNSGREKSKEVFKQEWEEEPVTGIAFDGKKDKTLTFETDENGKRFSRIKMESHLTVVSEPKGEFITSMSHNKIEDDEIKGAELEAKLLLDYTEENKMQDDLELAAGDSTATNSGRKNGVMRRLEKALERNLMRVLCALHTNELPLRHLFEAIDGKTSGKESWTGPLGKMLTNVLDLPLNPNFKTITGADLPSLTDEVVSDLSADQKYLYRILQVITTGKIPKNFEKYTIGPMNHARWLTLANRACRLYISQTKLSPLLKKNLFTIVQFMVLCYGPSWFHIKTKPNLYHSPEHVLTAVKSMRKLPKSTQDIVKPYIARNSYHAHPEHILLSMLCSDDVGLRTNAVRQIIQLRKGSDVGNYKLREFTPPSSLNFDATHFTELINWEKEVITEPPLTFKLTIQDLLDIKETKLQIKPYKVHTQSVERAVRMVTQASKSVYGEEARDGYVEATMLALNKDHITQQHPAFRPGRQD